MEGKGKMEETFSVQVEETRGSTISGQGLTTRMGLCTVNTYLLKGPVTIFTS